ncbi:MAG: hypothetical protein KatS3mg114_1446 [Planctomycetaceae bacterium]|nr:MAG: hypothetical protein KatS3mg114_1446 [Planctomycetaceae bacterium]
MKLFVIVATRQKIANLPPVLELAEPGDEMLWLVSDEAQEQCWADKPRELLRRRGLNTWQLVRLKNINNLSEMAEKLRPIVAQIPDRQYTQVYLVLNGGKKFTPIGVFEAFRTLQPTLLYGAADRAGYVLDDGHPQTLPIVRPYRQAQLDLEEIFWLNDYQRFKSDQWEKLWPGPLPALAAKQQYGQHEQYTYELHQRHHRYADVKERSRRISIEDLVQAVTFNNLPQLVSQGSLARWHKALSRLIECDNEDQRRGVFHATLNLIESAALGLQLERDREQFPSATIGSALEYAVARRVHAWPEAHRHAAIYSIWMGIMVAPASRPDSAHAEYDVLLVLTNGVLINLECKAAQVSSKDLDSRLLRLRQISSRTSRTLVVMPCFTRCQQEPWFLDLHRARIQVEQSLGPDSWLPFTWPEQPSRYTVYHQGEQQTFDCPTFEERLTQLLAAYVPR